MTKEILYKLEESGFPAYFVGGCIRDKLLNITAHDWDVCTSATPEQIKSCFEKTIDTGLRHGTVTVLINQEKFEVTTFRRDGIYSDGRRPDNITFADTLVEDLRRRDFTMNAIAMDKDDHLYDPFNGIQDIEQRQIRAVGDPDERFCEDALRILRALRFSATLGFTIEEKTAAALIRQKSRLKNISAERIFCELKLLLTGTNVGPVLHKFRDIIAEFIPEFIPTFDFDQNNRHHIYDVYTHTVKAVENTSATAELRLCMLLHDIAKPECVSIDKNGESHFYGHPQKSAEIAQTILMRLKCDNTLKKRILLLIREHDRPIPTKKSEIKKILEKFGTKFFEQLLNIKAADILAQAPAYTKENLARLQTLKTIYTQILQRQECFSKSQLTVNGTDMIKIGFKGKEIGETLQTLLTQVIDEIIPNEKQALINAAKKIHEKI